MSPTVSDNGNDSGRHEQQERPDALELLQQLLAELREQTRHLAALRAGAEIDSCLLEQVGRIVCMTANETHRNGQLLEGMAESLAALLAMYRGVHPDQALQLERLTKLEAELRRCCPGASPPELICHFEPCEPYRGFRPGDGYSAKSRGVARQPHVDPQPHEPWTIEPH